MQFNRQEEAHMRQCVIGVPKEVKAQEGRVGITPDGVRALHALGVEVGVEQGAGELSGFSDADYLTAGALTYLDIEALYRNSDIVVKVKEPTPAEYKFLPLLRGKTLFTYLHLAGVDPLLTKLLLLHKVNAIAYETVSVTIDDKTMLPLLTPMSRIAGVQAMRGALLRHQKEQYTDLRVVVLGGGVVGEAALNQALVNNVASVAVFEIRPERCAELEWKYRAEQTVSFLPFGALDTWGRGVLKSADIVISGVMLPGGKAAPKVLTQKHFRIMKHGAYIADVAIDQGGSTAWSKVTKPGETYTRGKKGLVFSCVPNIPGSTVPREATEELTKVTYPYVELLARHFAESDNGIYWALKDRPDLRAGLQTWNGTLTNRAVAEKHNMTGYEYYKSLDTIF